MRPQAWGSTSDGGPAAAQVRRDCRRRWGRRNAGLAATRGSGPFGRGALEGVSDTLAHGCCARRYRRRARQHVGMPFDRNPDGTIWQRPFGGHSMNFGERPVQRACASADRTGHSMLHTLYQRNVRARTQFLVEWMALDLIRDADGDVLGVTALEMETGEVMILQAKATLFATGGAGRIFAASTNAFINTGDGLGM